MDLTSTERYEITAQAFRIVTGYTAPGKDIAAAVGNSDSYEVRVAAWEVWCSAHRDVINAMLFAAARILKEDE